MIRPRLPLSLPRGITVAMALVFCAFGGGCAHGESAQERQWSQMRESMQKIQTDHDRIAQRLSALEVAVTDDKRAYGKPAPVDPRTAEQRVIHLSPGSERASSEPALNGEDPEDTTPRPSIRVTGTPGRSRGKTAPAVVDARIPDDDGAEGAAPPIRSSLDGPGRPSALDPEARRSYDAALALVHDKQYAKARDRLAAFLVKYPDHPNADNAMYWRGECFFAEGEHARALEQFQGVVARFPLGNKAPDALLKVGITEQKLGRPDKARASFDRLAREYPKSEAARRAPVLSPSLPDGARSNVGKGPKETP